MSDMQLAPTNLRQDINPWTWWIKPSLGQMGFINIQETASGDPAMERVIVEQAASYGRQLGRMTELLGVMLEKMDAQKWPASDQAVVRRFKSMADSIAAAKRRHRASASDSLDAFITAMRRVERDEPAEYGKLIDRLCEALPVKANGMPARAALKTR